MSPSNHLNQSSQSNSAASKNPQLGQANNSKFNSFEQHPVYNGQVAGAIVIHNHTHIYNSGVPQSVANVNNQALQHNNYDQLPSQSLSTSPPHSTPPHSSPSRSRRGLTFRHHPYNSSASPRRRQYSSNSSQNRSQSRSQLNHSQ